VAPARQYATTIGERTSLTLSDGSQVMLGPSTTLSVPANFGSRTRTLAVHGVAYFSVAHAATPFVVSAGSAQIRVLGTAFGVRHYDRDTNVTVAVQTGRVSVDASQRAHFLPLIAAANELAVVSNAAATVHRSAADVEKATAWTRGRLEFDDTPLRDVIPELERWYDVSFQLTDSTVGDVRLSGGFQGQGIDDLADALRFVLPLTVQQKGRVITIRPR
jgi:transmembrane sensor